MSFDDLKKAAKKIRFDMIRAIRPKESHHIGCSFSIVEILAYLYFKILHVDSKNPTNPERDIFILSKGHSGLAVYTILYHKGFFPEETFLSYDKDGGKLPEHIENVVPGIEFSTGSLGHGLPVGIGFATSFLNDGKKNHVYILMSDGELDEGSNWEAFMYAGFHKISNITVIVDRNGFQGYSTTSRVLDLNPIPEKLKLFGWDVYETDGHSFESLENAFGESSKSGKPKFIIAKTVKGKGLPGYEGKFEAHYKSMDQSTKDVLLKQL